MQDDGDTLESVLDILHPSSSLKVDIVLTSNTLVLLAFELYVTGIIHMLLFVSDFFALCCGCVNH